MSKSRVMISEKEVRVVLGCMPDVLANAWDWAHKKWLNKLKTCAPNMGPTIITIRQDVKTFPDVRVYIKLRGPKFRRQFEAWLRDLERSLRIIASEERKKRR